MQDYGAPGQEVEQLAPTLKMPFAFSTLNAQLQAMIKAHNPDAPVSIMRNAVDHTLFKAPQRKRNTPPTIGLMYRKQPTKGMDIAALALAQIRTDIPNLRAAAVGSWATGLPEWVEPIHQPMTRDWPRFIAAVICGSSHAEWKGLACRSLKPWPARHR